MNNAELSFQPFRFQPEASSDNLTADEERFVELFEASRNNEGREGVRLGDDEINEMLDNLEATDTYIVTDEDEEMVGVVAIDIQGDRVWLEGLATDRYQRSLGIGSFVIEKLVELAKESGCRKITGLSQPNNRTIAFYRQHGGYVDESLWQTDVRYVPMTIDVAED